ncbi:helix-turn-helix domain-containing protein [Pacificimonas sp. WHA3]|uniref:Helix-turn-helix domain-containing protein n=1 Tax=Pacificimonas pallii TaxID=2827236 RepID=A0ABS6SH65_9SPHN|nr:helix-turn-helix domain-containing protein [Pacificimonas pallii]MBV7257754.1 helix-turn-helix domain-containing protein [Pacificimonas pallii]
MTVIAKHDADEAARLIRSWRRSRGISQQHLAELADCSVRHLSFIETGRAHPSRNMLEALCTALRLAPMDVQRLHHLSGFAIAAMVPCHDAGALAFRNRLLKQMLEGMAPWPALALDAASGIVAANPLAMLWLERCAEIDALYHDGLLNFILAWSHADGLRHDVGEWERYARTLLQGAHRERLRIPEIMDPVLERVQSEGDVPATWLAEQAEMAEVPRIALSICIGGRSAAMTMPIVSLAAPSWYSAAAFPDTRIVVGMPIETEDAAILAEMAESAPVSAAAMPSRS